jgi:hypothetical protein
MDNDIVLSSGCSFSNRQFFDVTKCTTLAEATSVSGARRSDAHVYRGDCLVVVGDTLDYRGFVSLHTMIGHE